MRPKFKYQIIYRHRTEYPISVMCQLFGVSRSGYYSYVSRMGAIEKDADLAEKMKAHQDRCHQTYGYRRMHLWLESQGIHRNPKTVLRIMKKYGILSEIRRKRKWQNLGQQIHRYRNLLNRQFFADKPNSKWVTDISYIQTKEGVLYLSMIRDLYDNSIVGYKYATQMPASLVIETIRAAVKNAKPSGGLILHSDNGFQYTSRAYYNVAKANGIKPSMSSVGCPYDNACAENFFSMLKTECIYRAKPQTFDEAKELVDEYIYFYNNERIQLKTGQTPMEVRYAYAA